MADSIATLEHRLDDFSAEARRAALGELADRQKRGDARAPSEERPWVNLHCHTFFSYNAQGWSPSRIAWQARQTGLAALGIVDFDVLDGVDEIHAAGRLLALRSVAGMETRAFMEELAAAVINSPGEPGITYHMGTGFLRSRVRDAEQQRFLDALKASAQKRNLELIAKVNAHLRPVEVDDARDVLPLTPRGNATERHICAAYDRLARARFPAERELAAFWSDKLGCEAARTAQLLADPAKLQGEIRAKTMKKGGVGYTQPNSGSFPRLADVNRFVRGEGAIPTLTWLDGTSEGEADPEKLVDLHLRAGAVAANIIPDRNWNLRDAAEKQRKLAKLYEFVEVANRHQLPLSVGTEMNAPGLKFVDDFDAPELAPVRASFLRGAFILAGHTRLAFQEDRGYLSPWSLEKFKSARERNDYYEEAGRSPC